MMVKKIPKISVVMPVYNTGEILRASIDSILLQTFDNFELIMVDDGSADDTYSICSNMLRKMAGSCFCIKRTRACVQHEIEELRCPEVNM